jgi:hypothetical protein
MKRPGQLFECLNAKITCAAITRDFVVGLPHNDVVKQKLDGRNTSGSSVDLYGEPRRRDRGKNHVHNTKYFSDKGALSGVKPLVVKINPELCIHSMGPA